MMTRRIRASRAWLLSFGLLAGGLALAEITDDVVAEDAAWAPPSARPVEPSGPAVALDPVALEAFVEGFVTGRMKAHHAAGVTVSVVHDGRLVLARGFGHADRHLFEPLGMTSSTFREPWGAQRSEAPMPAALADRVSRGYQWRAGAFVPGGFEYIGQIGPAGALSTTAADMARWMLAHLGEGELDGVRILGRETARLMHRQHYTPDAAVPGIAHGFIESRIGGYRAIGHGGDAVHFISDMQLIPALGLGVFVSTNTSGTGGLVVQGFVDSLVERFFPQPTPATVAGADLPAGPDSAQDPETVARRAGLAEFIGAYLPTRRAYATVERALDTPVGSTT